MLTAESWSYLGSPVTKPYLFQYWDQPQPPEEVAGWIAGFAAMNPDYEHQLFDEVRAGRFIAEHFGQREAEAFAACAMPAMQADYFRICALIIFGGLYVDADNQCRRPLATLLDPVPKAMMLTWTGIIATGFIMFRRPKSPFLKACLSLATDNIEHRRFTSAMTSTGPGIFNAVWAVLDPDALEKVRPALDSFAFPNWRFMELFDIAHRLVEPCDDLRQDFAALTLRHTLEVLDWIGSDTPRYKETDRHWMNWSGDIYR